MSNRIHIVHLISSLDVGGAEMMLYKLISRIDPNRFQNTVICLIEVGPIGDKLRELGISVHSLGMRRGQPSLFALYRLVRLLHRKKPNILQTWLYHADLMGLIAARIANTPVVAWNIRSSNWDISQYRRTSGWVVQGCAWLSSQPEIVIINSQFGQKFHTQIGYHPQKWTFIPNGIDTNIFKPDKNARDSIRQELNLELNTLLIGMVARFDPMKDHQNFLKAAGKLLKKENVNFILVGRDVVPENTILKSWIAENKLVERVHLLGQRSDIARLSAGLDIATLSSVSEGFPNVIGEAMSCAIPCVVTDVGDAAQIVGNAGYVVPAQDSEALCSGWLRLIEIGGQERSKLGKRARQRIKKLFDIHQIVRQYEKVYSGEIYES